MEISAACLSHAFSSSTLHSPFSDQSHLQFYYRFAPKLCSTLPSRFVPSKPAIAPLRALAYSVCDAGIEPAFAPLADSICDTGIECALQEALMKELADLKLQMKQKKKELKAHLKDDKKKLKIEMKERKKIKKDVSEGKMKIKKCSADSSSSSSESSDSECESVSMKILRQGQGAIDDSRFNGEKGLECQDCFAGLPSRECAPCKVDEVVGCDGPSSNLFTSGYGPMEGFVEKSSRVSEANEEICFARASVDRCDGHVGSTSKVIPGQSHPNTASRALFSSQLGSVQSSNRIEVCAGGKCKKAGSEQLLLALRGQIPGTANVEAVPCKCMGKCSMAVNVRVHKNDTNPQHHSLVAGVEDATLILNYHFGLGRPSSGLPSLPSNEGLRAPLPFAVV